MPKNRKRLEERQQAAASQARLDANVQKMRNVVVEEKVILAMKPTAGGKDAAVAGAPAPAPAAPALEGAASTAAAVADQVVGAAAPTN